MTFAKLSRDAEWTLPPDREDPCFRILAVVVPFFERDFARNPVCGPRWKAGRHEVRLFGK
jgi:hypothetical protein